MMGSVKCPVCHVDLPVPAVGGLNERGLSMDFDESFVDEHVAMHQNCLCAWNEETGQRLHDPLCDVHGLMAGQ